MQERSLRFLRSCGIEDEVQLYNASTQTLLGQEKAYVGAQFSPYVDGDALPR